MTRHATEDIRKSSISNGSSGFLPMKKEYVVLMTAIGSGVVATILMFNFLQSSQQAQGRFVITHTAISKGQSIQEQDVGLSTVLKRSDARNLFPDIQDVVGQKALQDIPSNSLITRSKITRRNVEAGSPPKKSLPIPKGMRALTISRDDITNVPDLLDIGSYVDIIGSTTGLDSHEEMRTIVVSKQVISVSPLDGSRITSITIAVMPSEAEMVLQAASLKRLQLVVREEQATEQWNFESPASGSVEIIRGVEKERTFRR